MTQSDTDLVPEPEDGRRFRTTRRVRLGDADPSGRLRLDALARLLQDVGNDDLADAGHDPASPWVARRTVVASDRWPELGARLAVTTWCGGTGARWAERRTVLVQEGDDPDAARIDVATLWVHVDDAGRPARLPAWFTDTYGSAAGGRAVSPRLHHPSPPEDASQRPWALRSTDLDVLGHVNNAATWQAVEDELHRRSLVPRRAELEYHAPLDPDDEPVLATDHASDVRLWLVVGAAVRASAVVSALGREVR